MQLKDRNPNPLTDRTLRAAAWVCASAVVALAACTTKPPPPAPAPEPSVTPAPPPPVVEAPEPPPALVSHAKTPREYRKDGAKHLYGLNQHRIFKGQMPPLLHAVGVLDVEVDARGNVRQVSWMRAPTHAPQVMQEIERTVRQAAPFPAPVAMGSVTYRDIWLWDRSGNFQLDTLTEGQRSR